MTNPSDQYSCLPTEVPTATPLVYRLDERLEPLGEPDEHGFSGEYLRPIDEDWCSHDPYEREVAPRDIISVKLLEAEMARLGIRLSDVEMRRPKKDFCDVAGH